MKVFPVEWSRQADQLVRRWWYDEDDGRFRRLQDGDDGRQPGNKR